jgi:hypothetical protein
MSGAIPPLPNTPSWRAQRQPYLQLYSSLLISARGVQCFCPFHPEVLKSAHSLVCLPNPLCPSVSRHLRTCLTYKAGCVDVGLIHLRVLSCGIWRCVTGSRRFEGTQYPHLQLMRHIHLWNWGNSVETSETVYPLMQRHVVEGRKCLQYAVIYVTHNEVVRLLLWSRKYISYSVIYDKFINYMRCS